MLAFAALTFAPVVLAADVPAPAPPAAPAPERLSPRATMETYLVAINNYRNGVEKDASLAKAVACLDLAGAGLAKDLGPRYAEYLKDVLDRFWYVQIEELSTESSDAEFKRTFSRDGKTFDLLMTRQPNGEWLFSGKMLAQVYDLWGQVVKWTPVSDKITATEARNVGVWMEERVPSYLKRTRFLLRDWQWLGILILVAAGVLLDRFFTFLITRIFASYIERKKIGVPKDELNRVERPVGLAVMAMVWWIGIQWLNLPPNIYEFIARIAVFFLAASCVWAAYRLVDVLSAILAQFAVRTHTKMDDLLVPLVRKTLKIFVIVFGLVFIAGNLGIDISTMLAGLGIGGLAFALASKDTVENLFGSFTVLLDRPFQIGDRVNILGIEGIVEEVGFRSTRLRTLNNTLVTVPNSKLVSANIENQGPSDRRRYRLTLPLKPAVTMEKAQAFRDALRGDLEKLAEVARENIQVYIVEVGGAGIKIQMNVLLRAGNDDAELKARENLLVEIDRLSREKGVELA
ncbi:MAG: mechanosensitive ion channel family protein [Planctomycetes bacterium]|nr:mechanosensitive ion channel family protein [Planctomycetota bacterium]